MAISEQHIREGSEFFRVSVDPRGFTREDRQRGFKVFRYRRNGSTMYWKTRPGEYRIPVKYGLRGYEYIKHDTTEEFYPTEAEAVAVGEAMVARMAEVEAERQLASDFLAALQGQTAWELGDNGTMDTVLVCTACQHEVVCSDRESAIAALDDDCEVCREAALAV